MTYSTEFICGHVDDYVNENNTTKVALAQQMGMSRSALYEKLDGKRRWLLDEAIELADLMGCELTDLLVA